MTDGATVTFYDLRDAVSVMQAADCLDQRQGFVFVFDGTKVAFLPECNARDGFIHGVFIDAITPGKGMP